MKRRLPSLHNSAVAAGFSLRRLHNSAVVAAPFLSMLFVMMPSALGQEKKDAKGDEPAPTEKPKVSTTAPKEKDLVIKGTLTGLVQVVHHLVPLKSDQAYEVTITSQRLF